MLDNMSPDCIPGSLVANIEDNSIRHENMKKGHDNDDRLSNDTTQAAVALGDLEPEY